MAIGMATAREVGEQKDQNAREEKNEAEDRYRT